MALNVAADEIRSAFLNGSCDVNGCGQPLWIVIDVQHVTALCKEHACSCDMGDTHFPSCPWNVRVTVPRCTCPWDYAPAHDVGCPIN